jgi:hypothetical protein
MNRPTPPSKWFAVKNSDMEFISAPFGQKWAIKATGHSPQAAGSLKMAPVARSLEPVALTADLFSPRFSNNLIK